MYIVQRPHLHVGDVRLGVSELDWPREVRTEAKLSSRSPLAVSYHSVWLVWPAGRITWNVSTMEVQEKESRPSAAYNIQDIEQVPLCILISPLCLCQGHDLSRRTDC